HQGGWRARPRQRPAAGRVPRRAGRRPVQAGRARPLGGVVHRLERPAGPPPGRSPAGRGRPDPADRAPLGGGHPGARGDPARPADRGVHRPPRPVLTPVPNPTPAELQATTSFDLVIPPDADLLRVVRLVASGLASFTDLSIDAVEAVRVAADELVSTLVQASAEEVSIRFAITPGALVIAAAARLADPSSFELDPLADRILDEVATSHEFTVDGDELRGRIDVALP